jgi:hypothetical protein
MLNRAIPSRWTGHASRKAGAALRLCAALLLILQVVYLPIHLHLEPHTDAVEAGVIALLTPAASCVGDADHEGDDGHERHSASHHKLKALRAERAAPMNLVLLPVVECLAAEVDCPQPQVFACSGLSPPLLPRCWQFLFRAALPVRAPSFLT